MADKKPKKTYGLTPLAKKELRKQELGIKEKPIAEKVGEGLGDNTALLNQGLQNVSFSNRPVNTTTFEPPATQQNVTQQPEQQTETTGQQQNYLLNYGNSGLPNSEVSTLLGSVLTGQTQQNLYDNVSHSLNKIKEGAELFDPNVGLTPGNAFAGIKFMNGLAGLSFLPITAVNEVLKQNPVTDWLNKGAMLPFELADELYTLTQKGTDYAFEKITGNKPDRNNPLSQELDEFVRTANQLLIGGKTFHETGKFFKKGIPEVKDIKYTTEDTFANKLNEQPEVTKPTEVEKKPYEQPATIIGEQKAVTPEIDLGNKKQTFTKIINEFDKDLQTIEQKLSSGEITKQEFDALEKQYNETESRKKSWEKRLEDLEEEPKPIETITENKRVNEDDIYSEGNIKNPKYPDRTNEVIEQPKTEEVVSETNQLETPKISLPKAEFENAKEIVEKLQPEKSKLEADLKVEDTAKLPEPKQDVAVEKVEKETVKKDKLNKLKELGYDIDESKLNDKQIDDVISRTNPIIPKELSWVVNNSTQSENTVNLSKEIDGINGKIITKIFKGNVPYKLKQQISKYADKHLISSEQSRKGKSREKIFQTPEGARFSLRTNEHDNNIEVNHSVYAPEANLAKVNLENAKDSYKPESKLKVEAQPKTVSNLKRNDFEKNFLKDSEGNIFDVIPVDNKSNTTGNSTTFDVYEIKGKKRNKLVTYSSEEGVNLNLKDYAKGDLSLIKKSKLSRDEVPITVKKKNYEKTLNEYAEENPPTVKNPTDKQIIANKEYKREEHLSFIRQALSEGKTVPEEVLKDYPELKLSSEKSPQTEKSVKPIVDKEVKISNESLLQKKQARKKQLAEKKDKPIENKDNIPKEIADLYMRRSILTFTENALRLQMGDKELKGKAKIEYDNVVKELSEVESKIAEYEQNKNPVIEETVTKNQEVSKAPLPPSLAERYEALKKEKEQYEKELFKEKHTYYDSKTLEYERRLDKLQESIDEVYRTKSIVDANKVKEQQRILKKNNDKAKPESKLAPEPPTLTQKKQARKKQIAEKKEIKVSEQQKKANDALTDIFAYRERVNGLRRSDISGRANRRKNINSLKKAVDEFNSYSPESTAKISKSGSGNYIITIDGKPLRQESVRKEFDVNKQANNVENPEANKPFTELGAEERATQIAIAEDLDSVGTKFLKEKGKFETPAKVLKKGIRDIKDDSGKELTPEAIITREEMLQKSNKADYKERAEEILNKADDSDIPADADTSFNFGENAEKKPTIKTDDSDTKIKISQLEKRKKDLQDKLASGELDKEGSYKTTEKTDTSEQPDFFGKAETQSKLDLSTERDINEVRKREARKEIKIIDDEINKLKQSDYNSAKQTIKDALSKDSGISFGGLSKLGDLADPKVLKAVYDVAKYHTGKFAEWSKKVIKDVGNWIKPHLRNLYNEITKDRTGNDNVVTQGLNLNPIKKEVSETFEGAVDKIKRGADTIRKIIAPVTRGENAKLTAKIITEKNAELVRQEAIISEGFKEARKQFDKRSNADNLKMIDAIETGSEINNPLEKSFADEVRKLLDAEYKKVTDRKGVKSFIENYFPHIWEQDSQNQLQAMLSRRPLEGSKSFLKKRTIPTTREGIEAGLKPITYNPVDLALLKLHEMKKFNMAHEIMDNLKAEGLVKYIPADYFAPAGWTKLNDKIGTIFGDPGITATEYVDKHLYNALQKLATDLNIKHSRVAELRGTRMGEASPAGYVNTKYATPEDVLAHEIGHHLQFKYNLWDYLTGDIHVEGRNKTDTLKKTRQERVKIHKELRALADLRAKGEKVSDSHKRYLREKDEKMAVVLQAYTHIPAEMREVAPTIFSKFEKFIDSKPELRQIKQIKPSLVPKGMDMKYDKNGILIKGHYYLPEPATRIINNHLSPGLKGEPIFDIYRGISNTLNQVQLGASLFHASFTSGDANLSKLALGLMKISRGKKEGFLDIATSPIAFITNPVEGNKIRKDYLSDRPNNPELVNAITRAGGRISMDRFYTNDLYNTVKKAFKDGKYISGSLKSPFAMFEVLSKPVLEYLVPRQKLGVFSGLAKDILQDEAKGKLTKDQATERLQEAWRSVDNRMGQLVYDNLYWDHVVKDIAMASVRSVGWNLGTFRELGGGIRDIPKIITEKRLTPRTAYALALPIGIGLLGAVYSYLNGTPAESIKDLYFPRTGHKNKDGVDDRISLPSYMKDVYAYGTDIKTAIDTRDLGAGAKTLSHKMHPAISMLLDLINNHDYFGNEISDNTPFSPEWFVDEAKYIAKQFRPFTVNNISEMNKQGESLSKQLQSFFGFQLAPGYIRRSDMQNRIYDTYQKRNGEKIISKPEAETRELKRELKDLYLKDKNAYDEKIADLLEEGKISSRELNSIESDKPTDIKLFKYLPADDKIELWNQMNKEEKQRYQDGLTNKIRKTLNLPYKIPSNAPKGIIEKATPEQYTEYENEAEKRIMQFEKDNKGMDKDELQKQRNRIRKDIREEMNLETEKEKKKTHLYIPGQQNYFNQPKTFKNHLTIPK